MENVFSMLIRRLSLIQIALETRLLRSLHGQLGGGVMSI